MTRSRLLPLVFAFALASAAQALELEGEVVQVRDGRAHIRLSRPIRIAIGAPVQLVGGSGAGRSVVIALSSKFLVLEPGELQLAVGDKVKLVLEPLPDPAPPAAAEEEESDDDEEGGAGPKSPVEIGRKPGREAYPSEAPKFEKVPFKRGNNKAPPKKVEERDGQPVPEEGGRRTSPERRKRLEGNQVRGEIEVGVDAMYDKGAERFDQTDGDTDEGIERITAYGRLRLEVRKLFGSDRARFTLHGSVRSDLTDGSEDWTQHNDEQINARFVQAELAIDARPDGQVDGFLDRIELGVGRMTIQDVVEAYTVDGLRMGVRVGPMVFFGFGGFGVSPNPQREDYDSPIFGGGVRFATALSHDGAIRFSIAGAQERFRDEAEREFVEASFDLRKGRFGLRGAVVVDFYDALRDENEISLTTGALNLYWQVTSSVRFEVGYRERRPTYQLELVGEVRVPPTGRGSDIDDPLIILGVLETGARRNGYLTLTFDLPSDIELWLRGEVYQQEGDGRDAGGGAIGLAKSNLIGTDRLTMEVAVRARGRGSSIEDRSTDPFVSLGYSWLGQSVTAGVVIYYRSSIPSKAGESRIGVRGNLDADIYKGFGVRTWLGSEYRDDDDDDGLLVFGGLGLRYRF